MMKVPKKLKSKALMLALFVALACGLAMWLTERYHDTTQTNAIQIGSTQAWRSYCSDYSAVCFKYPRAVDVSGSGAPDSPIDPMHPGFTFAYQDFTFTFAPSIPQNYQQTAPCNTSALTCTFTTVNVLHSQIPGVAIVVPIMVSEYIALSTNLVSYYGLHSEATTNISGSFNPTFVNNEHRSKNQSLIIEAFNKGQYYTTLSNAEGWFRGNSGNTALLIMKTLEN